MKKNNFYKKESIINKKFGIVENKNLFFKNFKIYKLTNFLRKKIYLSNKSYSIKKTSWLKIFFLTLVFTLLIIAFKKMHFTFVEEPLKYLNRTLANVFSFTNEDSELDSTIFQTSLSTIISTIKISIFGTSIGLLLSIPTAFLSARNISKKWFINKPVRMIMALMRTIPPVVLALILSLGFNGWSSATLVLVVVTWSGMNKILYEEIESINMNAYYSMISMGHTKFAAFRATILRKIMKKFVEMGLYHFEISIRISAILGVVGGIAGIGGLIRQYSMDAKYFAYLAIPIFMILFSILIIEFLLTLIRVFILEKKTNPFEAEELNNFKNATEYRENIVNKNINKKIFKNKYKFLIPFYEFKRKFLLKLIRLYKYKPIDRNKLHKMAETSIDKVKNKYDNKIKIYEKLKKRKPKNNSKYDSIIDTLKIEKRNNVNRIVSLEQAKDKIFFVKNSSSYNIFGIILSISFLAAFIWSAASLKFGVLENSVISTWLSHIFDFNWELFTSSSDVTGVFPLISEALLLALVATFVGGIFAIIFGALASKNVGGYLSFPFQFLILLIRSFPPFLVAVIIAPMFRGNISIVGAFSLGLYSVGMLGKLIKSQFDQIDKGPIDAIKASGGSKLDAFRLGILPQVSPNIMSVIIYRWELNLKQTITVGIVGASQFGQRYYYTFSHQLYSSAFTYLWSIIATVIILEFFSNIIRKQIVEGTLPSWLNKLIWLFTSRSFIKKQLFLKDIGYNLRDLNLESTIAYYNKEMSYIKEKVFIDIYTQANHKMLINIENDFEKYYKMEIKKTIKNIYDKDFVNSKKLFIIKKESLSKNYKNYIEKIDNKNKEEIFKSIINNKKEINYHKKEVSKEIKVLKNIKKQEINNIKDKIKDSVQELKNIKIKSAKNIKKQDINNIKDKTKDFVQELKNIKNKKLIKFL